MLFSCPKYETAVVAENATAAFLIKERVDLYDYQMEAEVDFPEVLDGCCGLHHSAAVGIWRD